MSGDVQPRKRKDKKKKKDELSVEEPRGTAAALGEGDVFMHSQHDHGTGAHWCAKVIFFSLLAVLITLIGLIILENRGLSELEANSVESRYSGVLEGWIEDIPDDDHHDVHTLELKNHDEDDHEEGDSGHDDDDHEVDEDGDNADNESAEQELDQENNENEDKDEDQSQEILEDEDQENVDQDEDEDEDNLSEEDDVDQNEEDNNKSEDEDNQSEENYLSQDNSNEDDKFDHDDLNHLYNNDNEIDPDDKDDYDQNKSKDEDNEDDEGDQGIDNNDHEENQSFENNEYGNESSENGDRNKEDHDDEDDDDHDEEEDNVELEKLEEEADDQEPISMELPALPEADDDDDNDTDDKKSDLEEASDDGNQSDDDEDFLEHDEIDNELPVIERIIAPSGKPLKEVDEEESIEQPVDTLADEEEYERQQEELRRKEEEASHLWLKLGVGGALLLATHAVLRRAAAPRDAANNEDENHREETPLPDRRMTLIPEQAAPAVKQLVKEPPQKKIQEEMLKQIPSIIKSAPTPKQVSIEDELIEQSEDEEMEDDAPKAQDKELYSDEEIEEEIEEEIAPIKETPKSSPPVEEKNTEAEDDDDDDVEIIEEEDLEEQIEEEIEEEEISDVDDAELLSRLEAKYGRLPEPERPGQKHKDGGNSVDDDSWPGEPDDAFWRQQLDSAERHLRQGSWTAAAERASSKHLESSARARWIIAKSYDAMAEAQRDNKLLSRAITAYLELLKMNDKLSDKRLLEITSRTIDRIQFRGNYLTAEPVQRLLIRRFPDNPAYRNNLTIIFLMANRADLAAEVLKETLHLWPEDQVALAHYAFVLKTHYNKYEEAVHYFRKALEGNSSAANEPRFYYHWGDALLLLGRYDEAHQVHKRGATLGHFLSPAQRSLYNVNRLNSQPWWSVDSTPYARLAHALENNWKEILKEGEAARALYVEEKEGLRERGDWSQLDLFVRGREIPDRCKRAPVTCSIIKTEAAAVGCRRGQIKFSSIEPGTHVRPHVGPTNCRLRMHLALSNTNNAFMRVDKETRQWQLGKILMFDDSFEHEVWHNGTGTRLVLIVDVWHPDLTPAERRTLPAI